MSTIETTTLASIPARYFDTWNGRDLHAIDGLLADEFQWVDPLLPGPLEDLEAPTCSTRARGRACPTCASS